MNKCFKNTVVTNSRNLLLGLSAKYSSKSDKTTEKETKPISIATFDSPDDVPKMVDITNKLIEAEKNKTMTKNLPNVRWARAEALVLADDVFKAALKNENPMHRDNDSFNISRSSSPDRQTVDDMTELYTPKGEVFKIACLAGIQAAKQTSTLIPLCHQVPLSSVAVDIRFKSGKICIQSIVKAVGQATGVEMEALTAVSVAALTVYDMLKSLQRGTIVIEKIELLEKHGGKNGSYVKSIVTND